MAYNKLQALSDNISAIVNAKEIVCDNRERTAQDIEVLKKYSGFGGIKEVLDLTDYMQNLKDNRKNGNVIFQHLGRYNHDMEQELTTLCSVIEGVAQGVESVERMIIDSIKSSVLTAFYTPQEVVKAVGSAVQHVLDVHGIKAESLLETSAGIGGFLPVCASAARKVAFEKDIVSSLVLAALNPEADVFNNPFETIDKVMPEQTKFDIVASNIPFGDVTIYDPTWRKLGDDVHRMAQSKIHTYFFVKGLEQLEDGGILAFVTSRGVADSEGNEYLRRWLVENGNLLAAVRLPDNLFMQGSGIEVGSDLIVFQRDSHKSWQTLEEDMFRESIMKQFGDVEIGKVNRLLCLPAKAVFTDRRFDTDRFGQKMVSKYYWRGDMGIFEAELTKRLHREMERAFRLSAWKNGHSLKPQIIGMPSVPSRTSSPAKVKHSADDIRKDYDELMECYNTLSAKERATKSEQVGLRRQLNDLYDRFVGKFGTLHQNEAAIKKLNEPLLAMTLERRETGSRYVKADIFDHPVAFRKVKDGEVVTPMEALTICLNERGKVVMDYLCGLTGKCLEDVYEALKGEIFMIVSPNTEGCPICRWEHKAKCINGNVIEKRKKIEVCFKFDIPDFEKRALLDTVAALKAVTPSPIPYDDISIQLGSRWIPLHYFADFANGIFNSQSVKVDYTPGNDTFLLNYPYYLKYSDEDEWAAKYGRFERKSGIEIFNYALHDKCPEMKKTIGWGTEKRTVSDEEAMRNIQRAIDKMRNAFVDYMHSDNISKAQRKELEELYNEKFNCFVRADFDGAMQVFPNLDYSQLGFDDLYSSQKDAIWMLKNNNGGVCWHQVGAGKTMIMCVAAYEMHRLGLCNKPVIIGLKANVHQIAETFRKAYPSARCLYPGREDFSKRNREEFFNKIKNNDWDVIIMTHDQFCSIPMSPHTEMKILSDELLDLDLALEAMAGADGVTKQAKRGLETRKENLENRISELQDKINDRKSESIDFHTMGIDHIFVDEYHQFKNLMFTTRHNRVAGLGNAVGSQRAMTLLTAIRDIQMQRGTDMCASFFSGTVVVNALTELYVLFKYLRPKELERQNIRCFDAWAATFAKKTHDYDLTVTNEIKSKERFRSYVNVPELAQMLREITDYRTADMINLDIPKENVIFDQAEPTGQQRVMLERLVNFAKNGNWEYLGLENVPSPANLDKSRMLVATDVARKVSLDPRMLSTALFTDDENNKSSRCARKIAEYYVRFNDHKGVQFVFSDLSTYDKSRWNIYADIKRKLVTMYGIPENEVAFIQDYDAETKRKKLFQQLNAGEVRVIFGSTQKLGTGVNAQQRAVAVHHLDIPWRPADLEQRNGRAVRKGNEVKIWGGDQVDVIIYGTQNTLDAYKFNLLKNKAMFISQINNGTIATRNIDEDSMTEDGGMNFAEYVAVLSGNQDLLKKAKLDNKIACLEKDKASHQKRVHEAENHIEVLTEKVRQDSEVLNRLDKDIAALGGAYGGLRVKGVASTDIKEMGRALFAFRENATESRTEVGTWNGFKIYCWAERNERRGADGSVKVDYAKRFAIQMPSGTLRRANDEGVLGISHEAACASFDNLPNQLGMLRANVANSISYSKATIETCRHDAASVWSGAEELNALYKERESLQEAIDKSLQKETDAVANNEEQD